MSRAAASDEHRPVNPATNLLEQALEFMADECIEVTPETIRMPAILGITDRARDAKRLKNENQ